jgi:hypothetical protein
MYWQSPWTTRRPSVIATLQYDFFVGLQLKLLFEDLIEFTGMMEEGFHGCPGARRFA